MTILSRPVRDPEQSVDKLTERKRGKERERLDQETNEGESRKRVWVAKEQEEVIQRQDVVTKSNGGRAEKRGEETIQ